MKNITALLAIVSILCSSCTSQNLVSRGVIEHYFALTATNSENPDTIVKSKIWFMDSSLIAETVTISSDLSDSVELIPSQYTYIDLRTRKAEEYWNFRDTAKPFCSYKFDSSYLAGKYITIPGIYGKQPAFVDLPDLQEKGKKIRRVSLETDSLFKLKIVFYLNESKLSSIFTMEPYLDNRWSDFRISKLRQFSGYTEGFVEIGYEILETELAEKVVAIFESWSKNALQNDLELKHVQGKETPCKGKFQKALDHKSL